MSECFVCTGRNSISVLYYQSPTRLSACLYVYMRITSIPSWLFDYAASTRTVYTIIHILTMDGSSNGGGGGIDGT